MRLWNKIPSVKSTILSLFDKERREREREREEPRGTCKNKLSSFTIFCVYFSVSALLSGTKLGIGLEYTLMQYLNKPRNEAATR